MFLLPGGSSQQREAAEQETVDQEAGYLNDYYSPSLGLPNMKEI